MICYLHRLSSLVNGSLFLLLPISASLCSSIQFDSPIEITTSSKQIIDIHAIDIDQDSDLDVFYTAQDSFKVTWVENLQPEHSIWNNNPIVFVGTQRPKQVISFDMEGDGDLDAVSHYFNTVAIHTNIDNYFSTDEYAFDMFETIRDLIPGKIDQDRYTDLALLAERNLYWLKRIPGQPFEWSVTALGNEVESPALMKLLDFDSDRDLDIVIVDSSGKLFWLENVSYASQWNTHFIDDANTSIGSLHVEDFTGNGKLDFLVATLEGNLLLLEQFPSTFKVGKPSNLYTSIAGDVQISTADLDQDGDLDILYSSQSQSKIGWLENTIRDNKPWQNHSITSDIPNPVKAVSGDFDNDGGIDVMAAYEGHKKLYLFSNTTPRDSITFAPKKIIHEAPHPIHDINIADTDGDGDQDIAVGYGQYWIDTISLLNNRFPEWFPNQTITHLDTVISLEFAYINQDSFIDLLLWYSRFSELYGLYGHNYYQQPHFLTQYYDIISLIAAVGDFDRDHDMDIIAAVQLYDESFVMSFKDEDYVKQRKKKRSNLVYCQNPGNNHQSWTFQPISTTLNEPQKYARVLDFDQDGDLDFVIGFDPSNPYSGISWFENRLDEQNKWIEHIITGQRYGYMSFDVADVNQDGKYDVLTSSSQDNKLSWWIQENDRQWTESIVAHSQNGINSVAVHDFDKDGDVDFAVSAQGTSSVLWYEQRNRQSQQWHEHFIAQDIPDTRKLMTADLNRDGLMDLTGFSKSERQVFWFENQNDSKTNGFPFIAGLFILAVIGGLWFFLPTLSRTIRSVADRLSGRYQPYSQGVSGLLHASPMGMVTVNADLKIESVLNPAAMNLFNWTDHSAIPDNLHQSIVDANSFITKLQQTKEWQLFNCHVQRDDQSVRDVQVMASKIDENGHSNKFMLIMDDVTERKNLERAVLEISEREQRNIGHTLHDQVVQDLAGIANMGEVLFQKMQSKSDEDAEFVKRIVNLIDETMKQTRTLAKGLSPVELNDVGLISALEDMAKSVSSSHPIQCEVTGTRDIGEINEDQAINLYRIAQEAVANAVKHADASSIRIDLQRRETELQIAVTDDGIGFQNGNGNGQGMGMHIMKYRSDLIQAELQIVREYDTTKIVCTMPLP